MNTSLTGFQRFSEAMTFLTLGLLFGCYKKDSATDVYLETNRKNEIRVSQRQRKKVATQDIHKTHKHNVFVQNS